MNEYVKLYDTTQPNRISRPILVVRDATQNRKNTYSRYARKIVDSMFATGTQVY